MSTADFLGLAAPSDILNIYKYTNTNTNANTNTDTNELELWVPLLTDHCSEGDNETRGYFATVCKSHVYVSRGIILTICHLLTRFW